jgi:hypothetical protein
MARRRRVKEQPFGFDAFVDLVTNLVGIVLRLILVVMMGAHLQGLSGKHYDEAEQAAPLSPTGPDAESLALSADIEQQRAEVSRLEAQLLATLKTMDVTEQDLQKLGRERSRRTETRVEAGNAVKADDARMASEFRAMAKLRNDRRSLEERIAELRTAMTEIEKQPPDKRTLRVHHPLSRPVSSGELLFELRGGRVTFIDLQAFLDEVKAKLPQKLEVLRNQWETTDLTESVGAFRMRYTIARERSALDRAAGGLPPTEARGFSCGLDNWELLPVLFERGETPAEALADGSRFRQIVDTTDADQVVLTFFVYADSFAVYGQLRDYLYDRGYMVAGRPLGLSRPIAGSRSGTASRGQ